MGFAIDKIGQQTDESEFKVEVDRATASARKV